MSYEAASKTEYGPSNVAGALTAPRVTTLKSKVRVVLSRFSSGLTADEVAEFTGSSMMSIRPRMSELRNDAEVEDTGKRRKNASNHSATVWRLTERGWAELRKQTP
jgi:predicted ArsR family transcriptional regulator